METPVAPSLADTRALAQVDRDGLMVEGSKGQLTAHPAMAEIRLLTTELRLIEIELGLTPASEAKAGVPAVLPRKYLDDLLARRRADDHDPDDPRVAWLNDARTRRAPVTGA